MFNMDSSDIMKELRTLSRQVMTKEGVGNFDLNVEGQSEKGENYASEVTFFNTVSKETGKQYHFVMKRASRSADIRKEMANGLLYEREMYMYSEVLPTFHTFSKEANPSFEFDNIPKIYFTLHEKHRETLIMENLKCNGYRLWDRTTPMDLNHIKLVLENYGKFHALSMALNQKNPEHFQKLAGHVKTKPINEFSNGTEILGRNFEIALWLIMKCGQIHLAEKFGRILENLGVYFLRETKMENRLVITHGDCWNNNFMFKYEDDKTTTPTKMCFLDFQLSTLESPVVDLSYFIYSTFDDVAFKQFDFLLKVYHDSLTATMKDLGSQSTFTFEKLKSHWKEYAVFGLIMAPSIIKMELCTSAEAPDMNDIGKDGNDMSSVFNFKIENEEVYTRRILGVFTNYAYTCL